MIGEWGWREAGAEEWVVASIPGFTAGRSPLSPLGLESASHWST